MGKLVVILAVLSALAWFLLPKPKRAAGHLLSGLALCLPFILCLVAILILRF